MLPPMDPVAAGVQRCPFLHSLAAAEGLDFARNVAVSPFAPAAAAPGEAAPRRPVFEELEDFSRTFRLFHGPGGMVPLREDKAERGLAATMADAAQAVRAAERRADAACGPVALGMGARAASMSSSNFGFMRNLGDLFGNSRKPRNSGSENSGQQRKPNGGKRPSPKGRGGGPVHISAASAGAIAPGGQCPMRKVIGPLSALLIKGKCPPPIVKMRAALNQTQLVKNLRPQDLPVKVLAVAVTSALLNVPLGALRDHCRKFSPEWFLAVHATIPFVAMFRKAVLMPKYAMAITIAAAIGGQMVGARLERRRIKMRSGGQSASQDTLVQAAPLRSNQHVGLTSGHAVVSKKMACAQEAYVTDSGEMGILSAAAGVSAVVL